MVKLHVIRADTRDVGKQLVRVPASLSGATSVEYRGRDVPAQVDSRLGGNEIAIDEMMRGYLVVQLGKEYDFVVHATEEPEARVMRTCRFAGEQIFTSREVGGRSCVSCHGGDVDCPEHPSHPLHAPQHLENVKMMPGQTPYTSTELTKLYRMVSEAADADPGEASEPSRKRDSRLDVYSPEFQDALAAEFDRGGEKAARMWLAEAHYYAEIWIRHEAEFRRK